MLSGSATCSTLYLNFWLASNRLFRTTSLCLISLANAPSLLSSLSLSKVKANSSLSPLPPSLCYCIPLASRPFSGIAPNVRCITPMHNCHLKHQHCSNMCMGCSITCMGCSITCMGCSIVVLLYECYGSRSKFDAFLYYSLLFCTLVRTHLMPLCVNVILSIQWR